MKPIEMKADKSFLQDLAQAYANETKARELLESWRWPNGPVCPHCKNGGEKRISKLHAQTASKRSLRPGVYFCGACRQQFTVTVGTVLERSHVPISKWLMALFLLCSSKKSLSANQIHRMIEVTYKTAWFMCHRIRFGMTPNHRAEPKLEGTVEVDETFVGPKAKRKTPVVALIERKGRARVKVIASVTQKNLGAALSECVSRQAVVNTDEHPGLQEPVEAVERASGCESLASRVPAEQPGRFQGFHQYRRIFLFPAQTSHHWSLASYFPGAFAQICQRIRFSLEHALRHRWQAPGTVCPMDRGQTANVSPGVPNFVRLLSIKPDRPRACIHNKRRGSPMPTEATRDRRKCWGFRRKHFPKRRSR